MKALILSSSLLAAALLAGCAQTDHKNDQPVVDTAKTEEPAVSLASYSVVGDTIDPNGAQGADAIEPSLAKGGEVDMKVKGIVKSVCQVKGCWMKVELPDGKLMHVTFDNYSFFVPRDISGKEVVIEGKASLDTMAVEDLRHYAEDAGKSEKEIAAITQPEISYQFDARGVLIPKN